MHALTLKTGIAAALALTAALALVGCNKTADNSTTMPGSSSTSPSSGSMGSSGTPSGSSGSSSTGTGSTAMPPASAASGTGG